MAEVWDSCRYYIYDEGMGNLPIPFCYLGEAINFNSNYQRLL